MSDPARPLKDETGTEPVTVLSLNAQTGDEPVSAVDDWESAVDAAGERGLTDDEAYRAARALDARAAEAAMTMTNPEYSSCASCAALLAHRAQLKAKVCELAAFNDRKWHTVACDGADAEQPCECNPGELLEGYVQALLDLIDGEAVLEGSGPGEPRPLDARTAALLDSQYRAGVKAGWNAAQADTPEEATDTYARLIRVNAGDLAPLRPQAPKSNGSPRKVWEGGEPA